MPSQISFRNGPKAPPEDLEAQFMPFECQQLQDFSASMSEYRGRFTEDEKSQQARELLRADELDSIIADVGSIIAANEQCRGGLYPEAKTRRETFNTICEKVREEVFSDGEKNRTVIFQQAQDV